MCCEAGERSVDGDMGKRIGSGVHHPARGMGIYYRLEARSGGTRMEERKEAIDLS